MGKAFMTPQKEKRDLAKRSIAVVGEKADGTVVEWETVGIALLALGCCNAKLHEVIRSGKPYRQYKRITFKAERDASDR